MTTKGGTLHHVQAVTGGNLLIGDTKQTNFSKRGAIPQGKHSFNRIDSREDASLHIADTGPIQPVPFHSYRARSGCTNRINGICMPYQKDISFTGHVIECRINAENPHSFTPSPGRVDAVHVPGGPGVRVDSALYAGYRIPPYYDSLVGKLIVFGKTRGECLMRLKRALGEYVIEGVETTIPLFQKLVAEPDIVDGNYDIGWLEQFLARSG